MSTDVGSQELQQEIGLNEILNFLKKYLGRIIVFGLLSLLAAVVLLGAVYCMLPRKTTYVSTIHLQLPKIKGVAVYPNEKPFSANDILSNAVLKRVYDENNLKTKIKYEDFCTLFLLSGVDMEKALLAAAYRDKLNSKKISVMELKALEAEYAQALQQLDSGILNIAMIPCLGFTETDSVKLLNQIPRVWYDIYSRQEAKVFPRIDSEGQVKVLQKSLATEGKMLAFDQARRICGNLQTACKELDEMLAGSNAVLPSGESLRDLQEQLNKVITHRIQPLVLLVKEQSTYRHPLDVIALRASVIEIDKKIKIEKAKYEGALAAINILHPDEKSFQSSKQGGTKEGAAPFNVTLDSNFFRSLESLIRKSNTLHLRETYAEKASLYQEKIAELEAEKEYYMLMLEKGTAGNTATLTQAQFQALESAMFSELSVLCRKVNEFRDLIFKEFVQNRSFFTTAGTVEKLSVFYIPFKRIAVGIILLVLLLNVVYAGNRFYKAYSNGELSR